MTPHIFVQAFKKKTLSLLSVLFASIQYELTILLVQSHPIGQLHSVLYSYHQIQAVNTNTAFGFDWENLQKCFVFVHIQGTVAVLPV